MLFHRDGIIDNFEKSRIEEVRSFVEKGINPTTVSVCTSGGSYKITARDVANYIEYYKIPFMHEGSCFEFIGGGKNVKRKELP